MAHINKVAIINTVENPTEAQDRILRGVNFLADAVKSTLGPYGRNFLLEKGLRITNDGISIAKEIQRKDEVEDLGLRVLREAAIKTNDEAGDGTTTAITLAQAILKEIVRLLPGKTFVGKKSAVQVRKQVAEECTQVIGKLKEMAAPIKSKEELIEVAQVSVEDKDLANLIGGAQWDLGPEGVLIAEETNDLTDSVEFVSGVRFDNGFGTSLIMNNQEKQRLEVEGVRVIMTNYTFQNLNPLKNLLDLMVKSGMREIAIIARGFTEEAIRVCMENHKVGVKIYPINAPFINQGEVMRDLAATLGGTYFDQEERDLDNLTLSDVGLAKKIVCQRFSAVFTGEKSNENVKRVADRVENLNQSLKGEESVFQRKAIEARISQLTNGFALIKIGALSDISRRYKYDKAEDAVNAVKSALQEGVVPGAGLALKKISEGMSDDTILKRPLLAPYQQIMANAGEEFAVESWVKNSVKVERIALQNACQIAADLATTGGAVANERAKPKYVQVENEE